MYKGNLELIWISKDKSLYYEYDKDGNPGKPIWVDKNDIRVSEPRILKLKSEYGDVSELKDPLDNALIKGDNLLALRTLVEMFKERDEKDKVKLVYIDPPYNTGNAFKHYDDNLEHSEWLTMMRDRLILLRKILRQDGAMFIQIDDKEMAYLKVLMDEIFGRDNFIFSAVVKVSSESGIKVNANKPVRVKEFILVYAKNKSYWNYKRQYVESGYDNNYRYIVLDKNKPYDQWEIMNLKDFVAKKTGLEKKYLTEKHLLEFQIKYADNVFSIRDISDKLKEKFGNRKDEIIEYKKPRGGIQLIYKKGEIVFFSNKIKIINGKKVPTKVLSDIWLDINWDGIAKEGNVRFKQSKKPEKLIERILDMSTEEGDLILDSFLGSGTTVAVAHKMKRRWIGIEIGKHAETHCIPRLKKVVSGEDQTGISKEVNWKGGGGFRYYELGESLISDNKMNWSLTYEEIARALFMNFDYKFKEKINNNVYLGRSGHNLALCIVAKEIKIISKKELQKILSKIKQNNSTKIVIFTNHGVAIKNQDLPDNVSIKKIPESILRKYRL